MDAYTCMIVYHFHQFRKWLNFKAYKKGKFRLKQDVQTMM